MRGHAPYKIRMAIRQLPDGEFTVNDLDKTLPSGSIKLLHQAGFLCKVGVRKVSYKMGGHVRIVWALTDAARRLKA